MITEMLIFLMRRSMREASRFKLQFVPEHLYFSRFSPAAGGRRTVQTYRAGPTHLAPTNIATSGTPAHNKSDCPNTRSDDKERTPNKPTKRRLTRPHTARTTTADAT